MECNMFLNSNISIPIKQTNTNAYTIKPTDRYSIIDTFVFARGRQYVYLKSIWKYGEIRVSVLPDLSNYDPDEGLNIYDDLIDPDFDAYDGAPYEWEFSHNINGSLKNIIIQTYEDQYQEGLEHLGFIQCDSYSIVYGKLLIE